MANIHDLMLTAVQTKKHGRMDTGKYGAASGGLMDEHSSVRISLQMSKSLNLHEGHCCHRDMSSSVKEINSSASSKYRQL